MCLALGVRAAATDDPDAGIIQGAKFSDLALKCRIDEDYQSERWDE